MFNKFIKDRLVSPSSFDHKSISLYPISESNLEGIKILTDNCIRMGKEDNSNIILATIDPSIWLGDFLDKYWNKISYVTTNVKFTILKVDDDRIIQKDYNVITKQLDDDDDVDSFFESGKWKKFVIFSIIKYANLAIMKSHYSIKYADITEKFEERDNKINEILK